MTQRSDLPTRYRRTGLVTRRTAIASAAAAALVGPRPAVSEDRNAIPIGDMHAHLFFIGPKPASLQPLAPAMASGGVSLMSWSLVGDMPWIRPSPKGLQQVGAPAAGAATDWFQRELKRVKQHISDQGLKIATTPADIDRALLGEPHVVLSVEGASFLDDGLDKLKAAHAEGIRHVQLVHYVRNTIGDFQTEAPTLNGLSDFGGQVVQECNRLGVLVDLAHCTRKTVQTALKISRAPVVWSHSSVTKGAAPHWKMAAWKARQLGVDDAREIAAKGGVVGLWGLRSDVGNTVEAYAERLLEMAQWLGDDHVGFGTDLNALSGSPITGYADLRRTVHYMERQGVDRARIRKVAIENYARVLKQAMAGGQA